MRTITLFVVLLMTSLSVIADDQFDLLFASISSKDLHLIPFKRWNEKKLNQETVEKLGIKISKYDNSPEGYWALAKFKHAKDVVAYLLRVPSCYNSSHAVLLILYDTRLNKPLTSVTAADNCGDAGWEFYLEGWLIDLNGDGYLDVVTKRQEYDTNSADPDVPFEDWTESFSDIVTSVYMYSKDQRHFAAVSADSTTWKSVQMLKMSRPADRGWPNKRLVRARNLPQ